MRPNDPRADALGAWDPMSSAMLGHMVAIAVAQNLEQGIHPTPSRKTHRDLEIDQVRIPIISHNDILLFVQIHIDNAPSVEFLDERVDASKKNFARLIG